MSKRHHLIWLALGLTGSAIGIAVMSDGEASRWFMISQPALVGAWVLVAYSYAIRMR